MKVIICCSKKDFFFTKICAGSIRFYYPEVEIYILKDYLNGAFSSSELEKALNVKVLDLGIKKYGWSAAKVHLLLSNVFPGEKLLVIDSDIVFAGKFLESLYEAANPSDFTISADYHDDPYEAWFTRFIFDINYIKDYNPEYEYPGYYFNGGQMVISTGIIKTEEVSDFFDPNEFPYWKQKDKMPMVDQSLLNYLLPVKEKRGEIKMSRYSFWIWSEKAEVKDFELSKIKEGSAYLFLIHWAGALRVPYLSKMTRPDILIFFEDYYYRQVPLGFLKKQVRKILPVVDYYLRPLYRKTLKKLIKRNTNSFI